jgi:hypothetical protein
MTPGDIALAATTVFLVVFFALAEARQSRRSIPGRFAGVLEPAIPGSEILACDARVTLDDGRKIVARVSGCVLCQARFRIGDRVRVRRFEGGYVLAASGHRPGGACEGRA